MEQQTIKDKEKTLKLPREGREVYLQWCYTQKSLKQMKRKKSRILHQGKRGSLDTSNRWEFFTKGNFEECTLGRKKVILR